ncbi:MAG TPA: ComEC family competence protein [Candidatus Parcubacteria bacterium]|nr:ComEC family competence protein [Candidatus Parcubacteria bacterium]
MTLSKIFFYFCLFFVFGIFLASIISNFWPFWLVFLIIGVTLISVFWRFKKAVIIGLCFAFLFLGSLERCLADLSVARDRIGNYISLGSENSIEGIIAREPETKGTTVRLVVRPVKIGSKKIEAKSLILVITGNSRKYNYNEKVIISGKLKEAPIFEDFNYRKYLEKKSIYSIVYYPKIRVLAENAKKDFFCRVYAGILKLKGKLRGVIKEDIPPPQSSILAAMILGDKNQLSQKLKEKLNISGLRHITAVSGMHVVILSSILMSLLIILGFQRPQAFYLAVFFIFFFVALTGFQPSGVRAGIMGSIFLLSQKVGRKLISSRAIVITAALMLAINPFLLDDVGFQLSFLAALGIIYLAPIFKVWLNLFFNFFQNFFNQKPETSKNSKKLAALKEIIAMTFAAQVFTIPILIYNFGRVSVAAPLTNILVVPVVYWIMLLGFVFIVIGLFFPLVGWVFSLPCFILLTYLLGVVNLFSSSWAAATVNNVSWVWLAFIYLILFAITWRLKRALRFKFLFY